MRITRVYTRTGDTGTTRLVDGSVVDKDGSRIEAYGTVDELNSILGRCRALGAQVAEAPTRERIGVLLKTVQNELFDVGADLATPADSRWPEMRRVGDREVERLEQEMDSLNEDLEPLREFVLPGGGLLGASLHEARTVCRRAERRVRTLMRNEADVGTDCLRYLNRLSDFLFVCARWSAKMCGEPESLWEQS